MIDKNCVFCGEELHSVIKEPDFEFLHLLEMGTEMVNNSDLPVLFGGVCCKCMSGLNNEEVFSNRDLPLRGRSVPICGVDWGNSDAAVVISRDELANFDFPPHVNCRSAGARVFPPTIGRRVFVSTPIGGSRRREELWARRLPRIERDEFERFLRFFDVDEFRRSMLREIPNLENFFRDNYECVSPEQADALRYFRRRLGEILLSPIPITDSMSTYERQRAETFNRQLAEYKRLNE